MTIRKYSLVLGLASTMAFGGFLACGDSGPGASTNEQQAADGSAEAGQDGDAGSVLQLFNCSPGQTASIVATLNQGEIAQAQFVLDRASDPQVRAFAQQMIDEHGALDSDVAQAFNNAGVTPTNNWISATLRGESVVVIDTLRNVAESNQADRTAMDKLYITYTVLAHVRAIALMDRVLIPSATNEEIRSVLMDVRSEFRRHLDDAIMLQNSLTGECGGEVPSMDAGADAGDAGEAGPGAGGDAGADAGEDADAGGGGGGGGSDDY